MLDESFKDLPKVVGLKQTSRALEKGKVKVVYLAQDADSRLLKPIIEMCKAKGIEIREVPTMAELGKACGIKVGAAAASVLDV
ncbi:MAG: 50S ribosomal protein L7Ae-like protein [Peptococcaceae bacterium]|nr:50S ribosomal protein L7Ae-like protein [Peptococcaceae bacterium]